MSNKKNKLQGYDTLVSTFVLLSKESKKEVLDKLDKMDKVQVKSTHYYKGQLVLDMMHIGLLVGLSTQVLENTLVLIYQKCMRVLILSILPEDFVFSQEWVGKHSVK